MPARVQCTLRSLRSYLQTLRPATTRSAGQTCPKTVGGKDNSPQAATARNDSPIPVVAAVLVLPKLRSASWRTGLLFQGRDLSFGAKFSHGSAQEKGRIDHGTNTKLRSATGTRAGCRRRAQSARTTGRSRSANPAPSPKLLPPCFPSLPSTLNRARCRCTELRGCGVLRLPCLVPRAEEEDEAAGEMLRARGSLSPASLLSHAHPPLSPPPSCHHAALEACMLALARY
eukprot:688472-Rhodomonas_salina.2